MAVAGIRLQELIEDPAAAPIAARRPPVARGGVEFGCPGSPAVHFVRHPDCPAWPFATLPWLLLRTRAGSIPGFRAQSWVTPRQLSVQAASHKTAASL